MNLIKAEYEKAYIRYMQRIGDFGIGSVTLTRMEDIEKTQIRIVDILLNKGFMSISEYTRIITSIRQCFIFWSDLILNSILNLKGGITIA